MNNKENTQRWWNTQHCLLPYGQPHDIPREGETWMDNILSGYNERYYENMYKEDYYGNIKRR